MKFNTLFVAAVCASALLVSCNPKTATDNQLNFTQTTLVDGDAYQFFQIVGAKAVYESDYAGYVETVASSSQAKQVAAKSKEVYASLLPAMDSLATVNQVVFPIRGAEVFKAEDFTAVVDSSQSVEQVKVYSDETYLLHAQKEAAAVKEQIGRMVRSTNAGIQDFAKANLEKVKEIYVLAGGKEDNHAGH